MSLLLLDVQVGGLGICRGAQTLFLQCFNNIVSEEISYLFFWGGAYINMIKEIGTYNKIS